MFDLRQYILERLDYEILLVLLLHFGNLAGSFRERRFGEKVTIVSNRTGSSA